MYVGIPHETFGFRGDKGEDQDAAIELAYAITIHKSQGSDFDTVFVVLPKTGRILTYIIHSGFISGYQNRYGDNLKPPTNVYHRMTA